MAQHVKMRKYYFERGIIAAHFGENTLVSLTSHFRGTLLTAYDGTDIDEELYLQR